jgi:hypothetical protein
MAQAPLNSQAIELSGGHANRANQNLAFSGAHVILLRGMLLAVLVF